jgi:hypothetical protein
MKHPHGIHCLHVHGWHHRDWCGLCHNHWEAYGNEAEDEADHRATRKEYEELVNQLLVRGVILSMEAGALPLDAEILNLDMSELGIHHQTNLTPSTN